MNHRDSSPPSPISTRDEALARRSAAPRRLSLLGSLIALLGLPTTIWMSGCSSSDDPDPGPTGQGGSTADCTTATDCAGEDTDCRHRTCDNGACGVETLAAGTSCDDDNGSVCDGSGECVECLEPSDCDDGGACSSNMCVPAMCTDGLQNGDETGMDCGGSCAPCDNGQGCLEGVDCASGFCDADDTCAACSDEQDCDELTEWCDQGSCADKQMGGSECAEPFECQSGTCTNDVCE